MKKSLFALAAIVLMMFVAATGFAQNLTAAQKANLEASLKVDTSVLKAADTQQLLKASTDNRKVPVRPANADSLPETDPMHWYDMEWAGWNTKKVNIPKSPADGAIAKKVIFIVHGDHPWTTACTNGAKKVADAYKMGFKALSPNWDLAVQNQMIDQAINEKPDMILLIPLDAKTAPQQARKINNAGIPLILFNTLPEAEAMNYAIAWTGPDDFGQFRLLARTFAAATPAPPNSESPMSSTPPADPPTSHAATAPSPSWPAMLPRSRPSTNRLPDSKLTRPCSLSPTGSPASVPG